jgi:hypothetical protein
MKNPYIVENSAICLNCGEKIVSKHRHDFVKCKCGAIAVDGGQSYLRRLYEDINAMKDSSLVMEEHIINDCVDAVKWGRDTGRNDLGIALAVLRSLKDNNSLNIIDESN